jgi:hypothetical protein
MSDPTSPEQLQLPNILDNQPTAQNQEAAAPEKSNVQKRIDELTAERYAMQKQVETMMAANADLVKKLTEQTKAPTPTPEPDPLAELPEGTDPALIRIFQAQQKQMRAMEESVKNQTQQLYWQMQHQMDQRDVQSKYAHLPPDVQADAARRLTGLKQTYGQSATMDDAIKISLGEYAMKQMAQGRAASFNQMAGPLAAPSSPTLPNLPTALAPPTQRSDWDQLDWRLQNALLDEYQKKGGKITL